MIDRDASVDAETLIEVDGVYHPESAIKEALQARSEFNWLELLGSLTCWFAFCGLIAYVWSQIAG